MTGTKDDELLARSLLRLRPGWNDERLPDIIALIERHRAEVERLTRERNAYLKMANDEADAADAAALARATEQKRVESALHEIEDEAAGVGMMKIVFMCRAALGGGAG